MKAQNVNNSLLRLFFKSDINVYNLQIIINFCHTVRDKKKIHEGLWNGHKNGRIAWPEFCRSGALTPRMCPLSQNCNFTSSPLTGCFYSGPEWLCGLFETRCMPFPQSIAEVQTPVSEGNCSAASAKCHWHTKMLIYVAQRQHGKQAPGSSVLLHFFSFPSFWFSHKKWYRRSLKSGTECLWEDCQF